MNKKLLLTLLFTTLLIPLFSQSNEELDRFLNQDKADFASTVWLCYLSAEAIPYDSTPQQAMDYLLASDLGERFQGIDGDTPIKYSDYAYLIMVIHDLPGGIMYKIFHSPRYAARELSYRRWMPGEPKPGTILTPWQVTSSISQILTWKEAQQ